MRRQLPADPARRLAAHRGTGRAAVAVAVAHSILVSAYCMLSRDDKPY